MVKVDLITGTLGSGKTTFLKEYAKYLLKKGERICILENDYGAVNVDMMLLQELRGENCELEMVSGGCDFDCHKRRFKTKLIAMAMCGYDRVIIEPSGIFDVDEFFDTLYEEPLDNWYEIGTVIAVVNPIMGQMSLQARFLLASQAACAGVLVFSHGDQSEKSQIDQSIEVINHALEEFKCLRKFTANDSVSKAYETYSEQEFERIIQAGYKHESYMKIPINDESNYSSVYYMNKNFTREGLIKIVNELFNNNEAGNVVRVKGFFREEDNWYETNANHLGININPLEEGQDVIIIIGENLNEDFISEIIEQ